MISIDTNVLVRILVEDVAAKSQVKMAREFALHAENIFISQLVQAELTWVLKSAYKFSKSDMIAVLERLCEHSRILLQSEDSFMAALDLYKNHNIDFPDCLILQESISAHCKHVVTFDKKFGRLDSVRLLSEKQ